MNNNEIKHICDTLNIATLQETILTAENIEQFVRTETNLLSLYILLKQYQTGDNPRINLELDLLLPKLTDGNLNEICALFECLLLIRPAIDDRHWSCHLKDLPALLSITEELLTVKEFALLQVLLNIHPEYAAEDDLLDACLQHDLTQLHYKAERVYFATHLLPIFLKRNANTPYKIFNHYTHNLSMLTMIPISDAWWRILQDERFWQQVLLELEQSHTCKSAMYVLNIALVLLKEQKTSEMYLAFGEHDKDERLTAWQHFSVLFDASKEKQAHLIEPLLPSLEMISRWMPLPWVQLIYEQLLRHSHNAIAQRALEHFMGSELDLKDFDFLSICAPLNRIDIDPTHQLWQKWHRYCKNLSHSDYEHVICESTAVSWHPVVFYTFYKYSLFDGKLLKPEVLLEIIKNTRSLPHRYIRQGVLFLLFTKIKNFITVNELEITYYVDILLEFMQDDSSYKYATKLINLPNLLVTDDCLSALLDEKFFGKAKVDLIREITERKNVPLECVAMLYNDFKCRRFATEILDRLTYLYVIKAGDLQDYLMERLAQDEEAFAIRQMDKPNYALVLRAIDVLCGNSGEHQKHLALEILFYMTKSNYTNVYTYYFDVILTTKITSRIALNFVRLLIKIPKQFGRQHFGKLLQVYLRLFDTQTDEVFVAICKNFDFILENIKAIDMDFLRVVCKHMFTLKSREDAENAVRYLVRSIALNYKTINGEVLRYLLQELYRARNGHFGDVVVYYTTMYFKYLNFDYDCFPMYEFLLYPVEILDKNERAEYEVCTDIYLNIHTSSPYFRPAEIRKWALEDVLFDATPEKINRTVDYLIANYLQTSNKRYFPDSSLHLQKLRTLQVFAFLLPSINQQSTQTHLQNFLMDSFLQESHQPSVRLLIQYLLIQLLKNDDNALNILLDKLKSNSPSASTTANFIPIIFGLDLIKNHSEFSRTVIETALDWTMGANFKLRFIAQKLIQQICHKHRCNYKFRKYETLYKAVDNSVKNTPNADSHGCDFTMIARIIEEKPWKDPKKLMYIITVYIPEATGVIASEWEYFKMKHYWSKWLQENAKEDNAELLEVSAKEMVNVNLQRKITPWNDGEAAEGEKSGLVVVATLIESAANLGGLSRTCEIFGRCRLVVENAKITENKDFVNLSMTSEQWLEITEVKPAELMDFLGKSKNEGFRIVGVEQSLNSHSLETYKFQQKTLLLLGNERRGIPAPLLALLDDCIEIPQYGLVRSLNVHVAGAVVIWEYTKQHVSMRAGNVGEEIENVIDGELEGDH